MSPLPKSNWEPFDPLSFEERREGRKKEVKVFYLRVFPQMSFAPSSLLFTKYL